MNKLREKVALSLARLNGHNNWRRFTEEADAAIAATIQGLIEMKVPDSIPDYVYEAEFRAILTALKPLLRAGETKKGL